MEQCRDIAVIYCCLRPPAYFLQHEREKKSSNVDTSCSTSTCIFIRRREKAGSLLGTAEYLHRRQSSLLREY